MSSASPNGSPVERKFQEALALHQQSRFAEAQSAYGQVLHWQPRHVQALTFLGAIALESGEVPRALELMQKALEADPSGVAAHLLHGHALAQIKRHEEAVASYDCAIALRPDLADAHFCRGNALHELGRHADALASYDQALAHKPGAPEIHNNRANALRRLGKNETAIAGYQRAIELSPQLAEAYFNRGLAQHELKRHEAALASYDEAIAVDAGHAEAHCSRGTTLHVLQRPHEALASFDRAIAIRPNHARAYSNRGNVLAALDRLDEALASYDRALALAPDDPDIHCNRGNLLGDLGRHGEALASLDQAIALDPHHALAHFSRSFVHLARGDFERGWRDFEWRWKNAHCVTSRERRTFREPLWLGDAPLAGKTILVYCEQGLGDTIQFCRYAALLEKRGARVIFEVPRALQSLFGGLQGVSHLLTQGEPLPPFDYHCPLMSLPLALKTTMQTIPSSVPYLRADPERMRRWSDKLSVRTRPRVGLVWSGGLRPDQPELWAVNNRRNIPLAKLARLKRGDVEYHSLQKGQPAENELAALQADDSAGPAVFNHAHELGDFAETAALITQLDLVISVDTSTAHLAGALGTPVWVLNRFDTCWRWLLNRADSPWYPTLRLYRQQRAGDWDGVVQAVRRDLAGFARGWQREHRQE
jgi:tetratricopeptide (TPR) repeat protein